MRNSPGRPLTFLGSTRRNRAGWDQAPQSQNCDENAVIFGGAGLARALHQFDRRDCPLEKTPFNHLESIPSFESWEVRRYVENA